MLKKQTVTNCLGVLFLWGLLFSIFWLGCFPAQSVELNLVRTWTAPGDDWTDPGNTGGASVYDLRYAGDSLLSWDQWAVIPGLPVPDTVGALESFSFSLNLVLGDTYFFAIRSADEKLNWSERSNIVTLFIPDDMPPNTIIDFQ